MGHYAASYDAEQNKKNKAQRVKVVKLRKVLGEAEILCREGFTGREAAIVRTKIEEAQLWATKL